MPIEASPASHHGVEGKHTAKKIRIRYSQKSNFAALFPVSKFIHLCAIYTPRTGPPILLYPNRQSDRGNYISLTDI